MGNTNRRSKTRLLRSSKERRCTLSWLAFAANNRSSSCSISSSSCWTDPKWVSTRVVQQSMREEGDTMLGQVAGRVPALYDRLDVDPVVLAHGDQGAVSYTHLRAHETRHDL